MRNTVVAIVVVLRLLLDETFLTTLECILASSAFNRNSQCSNLIIPPRRFVNTVYFSCVNRIVIEMPEVEKRQETMHLVTPTKRLTELQ